MKPIISKIKRLIIIELLFHIIFEIGVSGIPAVTKWFFDHAFHISLRVVAIAAALLVVLQLLVAVAQYISQNYEWKVDAQFTRHINNQLFSKIISQKHQHFIEKDTAEYLSFLTNQVDVLRSDYLEAIIQIIKSCLSLVVYTTMMIFIVDLRITLVLVALSLFAAFIPKIISERLSQAQQARVKMLEKYFSRVEQLLRGFHLINPFTIKSLKANQRKFSSQVATSKETYGKIASFKNNLNNLVLQLIGIIVLVYSIILLRQNVISLGAAVAALTYVDNFLYPIQYILNAVNQLHGSKQVKAEVSTVLAQSELSEESFQPLDFQTIIFEQVQNSFMKTAQTGKVFQGQKVLLSGASGAGKTTFLNLLSKIDDDFSGHLTQNNAVYYADQFPVIFDSSFEQNVTLFGAYPLTNVANQILELLGKQSSDFETSKSLSGGEKQILAFIRAMNAPQEVVLLDEPFSAVDQPQAEKLLAYLLQTNKTIFMVSHATLEHQRFDQVLFF